MKKYNCDITTSIALKQTNLNQKSSKQALPKKDEPIKFIENLDILLAQEEKQLEQHNNLNDNSSSNQSHLIRFDSQTSQQHTPSKLQALTQVNSMRNFYFIFSFKNFL